VFLAIGVFLPILGGIIRTKLKSNKLNSTEIAQDQGLTFLIGIIFGSGLLVAGMVRRVNIISFLSLHSGWNPSLLLVLGFGVGVNLITFNYMIRVK
jgi:hypothetical protein